MQRVAQVRQRPMSYLLTVRCYASTVYAVTVSVRLSQAGIVPKRQNVGSHNAHGL